MIERTARPRRLSPRREAELRAANGGYLPSSTIRPATSSPLQQRTPLKKVGKGKAKRQARNAAYYKSAEWRKKRKLTFERDGYRCTETIPYTIRTNHLPDERVWLRCPNMGMNINGQQTGKGLVCEEVSYGHRGIPDRIDTCKTRCRECDRRLTPRERINHAHGFQGRHSGAEA